MKTTNRVFVVDTNHKPLTLCRPVRARQLLWDKKAAVLRRYPFTIILKESKLNAVVNPVKVKVDPGANTTGIALVDIKKNIVIFASELEHRGFGIKSSIDSRRSQRRSRRNHNLRYREARFDHRTRTDKWLPPSLRHRVETTMTWINRFMRFAPIESLAIEHAKFDIQKMQNPEISVVGYQQGELFGYEVREYLLEKWGRKCAYCGKENIPLEVEHIVSKSKGGTDRVSNLTISCRECNESKGNHPVAEFLADKSDVLKRILAQAKSPLKSAAITQATRNVLTLAMCDTNLIVETGTGAQTKMNRVKLGYKKAHWIDAACVGSSGVAVNLNVGMIPMSIKSKGHGNRQMCGTDKFGFPIRHRSGQKKYFGFETGDIVKADVLAGKKNGRYIGRVLCRKSGSFDISTAIGRIEGIPWRCCKVVHANDGYSYRQGEGAIPPHV